MKGGSRRKFENLRAVLLLVPGSRLLKLPVSMDFSDRQGEPRGRATYLLIRYLNPKDHVRGCVVFIVLYPFMSYVAYIV